MLRKKSVPRCQKLLKTKLLLVITASLLLLFSVNWWRNKQSDSVVKTSSDRAALEAAEGNLDLYPVTSLVRGVTLVNSHNLNKVEKNYQLDIPLKNQMSDPPLLYGCEVTALGMILEYYGYEGNKNKLQEAIEKQPYQLANGLMGNPHKGFVGDASGKQPGTGVYHEPIARLAQKVVGEDYLVVDATGQSVKTLLAAIRQGSPVWVAVTIDYSVPTANDFTMWQTSDGDVEVSHKYHAAVITGYDEENIFLNDALGKRVTIKQEQFSEIYQGMGKQSIYLTKN
ncbi:C39 family peptidase [Vagococcus salmoninarum]|uniref:Peptidase C39-like domain-containing protein n=1 Tax=Vagococcus salmoninarum TaxID=2739 RepID=A0A429ZSY5_9ENTE|nr:C39 family peptidase [Vagococcus salmoninarum]RST96774.1 hypothetical protein CBF35_04165 [Vagococcus salmoninarum]